jgi:predicted CXXCH cytochrome family protein
MHGKNWKYIGFAAVVAIILVFPAQWIKYHFFSNKSKVMSLQPWFVGGENCVECHKIEYDLWLNSHHDLAMEVATDSTVLGDFNDAIFVSGADTSRFFKREGKFFVHTRGPDGLFGDFLVAYTFGWWPLQQYLIPFENGKYQTLNLTWDSDKNEWYNMAEAVYSGEEIQPGDWLYWTNQGQNWNSMCAECHSTNLQKNFNPATRTYNTTWSDIDVHCETCHGPGSAHLDWAALPEMARPTDNNTGLVVVTRDIATKEYVDLCARCHARRSSLDDFDHFGSHLLDHYIPQLVNEPMYYSDGQILEEDYVYGSFTQSRMFTNDIKCNDCHDAHSLALVKTGNDLCLQCHRAGTYDTYQHHFHKIADNPEFQQGNHRKMYNKEGEGALCINCHMDGRFYMGADYRRDHSFRIPRPDLTISIGVPNACNSCHTDKTAAWSEKYITEWYGKSRNKHYGSTFAAAEDGDTAAIAGLIEMSTSSDNQYPPILRATAASLLANFADVRCYQTLRFLLNDPAPLIRTFAVRGYQPASYEELKETVVPLLNDPVKSVRIEAANKLTILPPEQIDSTFKQAFEEAVNEYETAMLYTADFPASRHNLGNLYTNTGRPDKARENYQLALEIDKAFYPAKVNLAMLYNQQGKNDEAEKLFREAVVDNPEDGNLYYSLGLLLAEMQKFNEATKVLEKASELMPGRSRIFYNLGLLYQYLGDTEKNESRLLQAYQLDPSNQQYIYALAEFYSRQGNLGKAEFYSNQLNR